MARMVRNPKLDTRSARARLKPRREPYWCSIAPGRSIGYRRLGPEGGTWIAKLRVAGSGRWTHALGPADDSLEAGRDVLTFAQAQERARKWFEEQEREAAAGEDDERHVGPYTVRDAADAYLAWFKEHRKSYAETKSAIEAHVVGELGDLEVSKLTTAKIRLWHEAMAKQPARLRTRPGRPQRYRPMPTDPEGIRARRATANRLLTDLKALLAQAFEAGKVESDLAWRRVKPFRGVDASRERFLEHEEMARLCNACEPDFRYLVRGALLTGARYGELCNADVQDYSRAARKLQARLTKGGKPRWIPLDDEAVEFFDQLTTGRSPTSAMFLRTDGERWGKGHQRRRLLEASTAAKIDPPITYHGLRHTWASHRIMRGAELMVVAKVLGHRDTRMVEKHYGHLRPSYVDDAIRATGTQLSAHNESNNVSPLRPARDRRPRARALRAT